MIKMEKDRLEREICDIWHYIHELTSELNKLKKRVESEIRRTN